MGRTLISEVKTKPPMENGSLTRRHFLGGLSACRSLSASWVGPDLFNRCATLVCNPEGFG